jgi:hypothetical protein
MKTRSVCSVGIFALVLVTGCHHTTTTIVGSSGIETHPVKAGDTLRWVGDQDVVQFRIKFYGIQPCEDKSQDATLSSRGGGGKPAVTTCVIDKSAVPAGSGPRTFTYDVTICTIHDGPACQVRLHRGDGGGGSCRGCSGVSEDPNLEGPQIVAPGAAVVGPIESDLRSDQPTKEPVYAYCQNKKLVIDPPDPQIITSGGTMTWLDPSGGDLEADFKAEAGQSAAKCSVNGADQSSVKGPRGARAFCDVTTEGEYFVTTTPTDGSGSCSGYSHIHFPRVIVIKPGS